MLVFEKYVLNTSKKQPKNLLKINQIRIFFITQRSQIVHVTLTTKYLQEKTKIT